MSWYQLELTTVRVILVQELVFVLELVPPSSSHTHKMRFQYLFGGLRRSPPDLSTAPYPGLPLQPLPMCTLLFNSASTDLCSPPGMVCCWDIVNGFCSNWNSLFMWLGRYRLNTQFPRAWHTSQVDGCGKLRRPENNPYITVLVTYDQDNKIIVNFSYGREGTNWTKSRIQCLETCHKTAVRRTERAKR